MELEFITFDIKIICNERNQSELIKTVEIMILILSCQNMSFKDVILYNFN